MAMKAMLASITIFASVIKDNMLCALLLQTESSEKLQLGKLLSIVNDLIFDMRYGDHERERKW
jgi:hypothetical protein